MEQGGTGSRINCINPPGAVIDTKCIAIAFNYRHLPLVKNKIATVTRGTVAKGLREEKKSKRKKKGGGGKERGEKHANTYTRTDITKQKKKVERTETRRARKPRKGDETGIAGQALVNYTCV